jgi:transcriptional regulator with PAS, ATPase and Fis domain
LRFWENLLPTRSFFNRFVQLWARRKAACRRRDRGLLIKSKEFRDAESYGFQGISLWGFVMVNVNTAPSSYEDCAEDKFEEIVGSSPALKLVLAEVERVAPTDATVLVLGETGTGKERFAEAIHNVSTRSDRPYIKLNCAAIPFDLLESELFGY